MTVLNYRKAMPRVVLLLAVLTAAVGLKSAGKNPFTKHDKAYYAKPELIDFVRPGLVFKVTGASIAVDGTITAKFTITDPSGLPLDRVGVTTPGAIRVSFIAATIPNGQKQYTAYTATVATASATATTATQASSESNGTFTQNSDGTYTYVFKTKAPAGFDPAATHTIAVYGSRDLTAFNLGTNYASATFDFVPNGAAVVTTRDVVRDSSCNSCHDQLSFHGGSRIGVQMCVLCHTPQTSDPNTGNTLDFPVMVHKIHMGSQLPSVQAGTPYQIVGYMESVNDFSGTNFPADAGQAQLNGKAVGTGIGRCTTCHNPNSGAKQANAYITNPNQAACGACHDDVNFASGKNHVNLPQTDSKQCSICHTPQGELEFDASIIGAHTVPTESAQLAGINFQIANVADGTAGSKPTVTFSVKDNAGNAVAMSELHSTGRLALVLGGNTANPGYTNFGSDVITGGYVSEDVTTASTCGADGNCTYTFKHAVPSTATGTFSIGIEGRRVQTLLPGTEKALKIEYGGKNVVSNFSVDGSPTVARRVVVDIAKCNMCHSKLSLHGENRNQIEQCVLCHNPSETDYSQRINAADPALKNGAPQSVNFALMVHRIHFGAATQPYTIVAFGGNPITFGDAGFPAMFPTGDTGAANNCALCHVNGSEQNFPTTLNNVKSPQSLINPTTPTTSACTACHTSTSAWSHALANTTALGESCETCHGAGAQFNVAAVHAN